VFAMILSCSRALFIQPVLKMDQQSWNALNRPGESGDFLF